MVEEMYLEEIKEHEQGNASENTKSKESSKELGSTANVAPESGAIKLDHLQSKQESFKQLTSFKIFEPICYSQVTTQLEKMPIH